MAQWLKSIKDHEVPEQVIQSLVTVSPGWKLVWNRTLWWRNRWTYQPDATFDLWQSLENYADLQSPDVRDKVFGFLRTNSACTCLG